MIFQVMEKDFTKVMSSFPRYEYVKQRQLDCGSIPNFSKLDYVVFFLENFKYSKNSRVQGPVFLGVQGSIFSEGPRSVRVWLIKHAVTERF